MAMRGVGDLSGFVLRAMIAPEVIVAEGRHVGGDGNDGGAGGVDGDAATDVGRIDGGLGYGVASGGGEGAHVVVVGLRGVLGIFPLAVEWVRGGGGGEQAAWNCPR